jgi:hypothetical protein
MCTLVLQNNRSEEKLETLQVVPVMSSKLENTAIATIQSQNTFIHEVL